MHIVAADTCMDCEVVNTLFTLFYEGVTIDFPCQILYLSVHLLQRLIDRNGTNRNRTVAYNPFASLVDVIACR